LNYNKTKKICMIVQNPYPKDVRVRKEAMVLVSHGHEVSVIAIGEKNEKKEELVDGVKIHRLAFKKKRSGKGRYLVEYIGFFLYAFFKLNLLDIKEKFDIIHINTLPDVLVFSAVVQKLKGRRIILDMHEIMPEFYRSKFGVSRKHPLVKLLLFLERISLNMADDVITVNESIKRVFRSRSIPQKPITVIMNTVSASSVKTNQKKEHKGFNCVYHGTLTDIYGLDTAIEGFSSVSKKYPDLVFHIFGDGPFLPDLKQLTNKFDLNGSIHFHGELAYSRMMEELMTMDLGILAIRKDIFLNLSFSNKLAEYVYLKIPVVSSDLDAVKYYFSEEQILFFCAGDVGELAKKIEFAYLNRQHVQAMAEAAYERSKSFDWDIMAERYLKVVEGPSTITHGIEINEK
jgi:glycosyltransferase involved in cell wall biosynthesis